MQFVNCCNPADHEEANVHTGQHVASQIQAFPQVPMRLTPMPLPTRMTKAIVMLNELPAMPIRQVKSPAKVMTLHSSQRRPLMPHLHTPTHFIIT